jgi:glycosyltransferase involved in cell wall biosynthesis
LAVRYPAQRDVEPIGALDTATALELSIVMPCLNEVETLGACIQKAQRIILENDISGEIVVADNGSTDGSQTLATAMGVRVVPVESKGYGSALMGGIAAARGKFILMGDADDSYDFLEVPKFLEKLRQGYELVQGCRLPVGGGTVAAGAMPALHRWLGNPMLTWLARRWFRTPVHDVYCGMRAFTKDLYCRLNQRCTGMEFATEMIIKSSLYRARIAEVPITLHPDGRKAHPPHLKTFRDGWRTLRFFLIYSPRWLFLIPGLVLILLGAAGYCVALPGLSIGRFGFDVHTLLFASLAVLCGYQSITFAVLSKTFAISEGLLPNDPAMTRLSRLFSIEKGILIGVTALIAGLVLLAGAVNQWRETDFGRLDYSHTMRWVIPGATLTALGFQTVLSSFFVDILRMRRK